MYAAEDETPRVPEIRRSVRAVGSALGAVSSTQHSDQLFLNRLVTAPYMKNAWKKFVGRAEETYGDNRETERLAKAFFEATRRARHRQMFTKSLTVSKHNRAADAVIKALDDAMMALRRYPGDLSLVDVLDPGVRDLLKSAWWDLRGRRILKEEQLRIIFPFYRMLEVAAVEIMRRRGAVEARRRATTTQDRITLGVELCAWLEKNLHEPLPSVADAVVAAAFELPKPTNRSSISRAYHATALVK